MQTFGAPTIVQAYDYRLLLPKIKGGGGRGGGGEGGGEGGRGEGRGEGEGGMLSRM